MTGIAVWAQLDADRRVGGGLLNDPPEFHGFHAWNLIAHQFRPYAWKHATTSDDKFGSLAWRDEKLDVSLERFRKKKERGRPSKRSCRPAFVGLSLAYLWAWD